MFITAIVFLITLLVLILSHELGHFLAAKKFDIKVLEFGFGIPPRAWGRKIGETLVSLNWLPFGGFVKLLGEDETDKKVSDNPRSFATKRVGQRITVVVAGVVMNLLLAVILFWIVLAFQGFKEEIPLLTPYKFAGVSQVDQKVVLIGNVAANSPAQEAGIKLGDRVARFNGIEVASSSELVELTKKHLGEKITLTITSQDGTIRIVEVIPRINPPQGEGALGVELMSATFAKLTYTTIYQKAAAGFIRSYNLATYSIDILGKLIATSISRKSLEPVSQSVSGPVGITNISHSILQTRAPILPYLDFVAALSLNLALINILPIPALDGGRLLFLLIEAAFRKKVQSEVEKMIHAIGMALLLALIILITLSDIKKFL